MDDIDGCGSESEIEVIKDILNDAVEVILFYKINFTGTSRLKFGVKFFQKRQTQNSSAETF